MGYTTKNLGEDTNDFKQVVKEIIESGAQRILLDCSRRGNVVYGADRELSTGKTSAFVMLYRQSNRQITYKLMDESECPYYFDCPAKILKLLSETDNVLALKWRSFVRIKADFERSRKNITFTKGDRIKVYGKEYTIIGKNHKGKWQVVDSKGFAFKLVGKALLACEKVSTVTQASNE